MALLNDSLSVWEIAFRWEGHDPRRMWLRIPLGVQDHFRNLLAAILSAELLCETITLEKRDFRPDEKIFSIYYWIDDIYACIAGHRFNRKLLRFALVDRDDLQLWCERMNIPLPEFWFPPGWNREYALPEYDIHPGHYYYRKDWSAEQWAEWRREREDFENSDSGEETLPLSDESEISHLAKESSGAFKRMRPSQEARIACRQIASVIWKDNPNRLIASVIEDELILKYGGGQNYQTVLRDWIKDIAPPHVRKPGRPKKGGEEA